MYIQRFTIKGLPVDTILDTILVSEIVYLLIYYY